MLRNRQGSFGFWLGLLVLAVLQVACVASGSQQPPQDIPVWMALSPAGGPPQPRSGGSERAVGYDAVANRLILFGGSTTAGSSLDELWVLTGADGTDGQPQWLQLAALNTPAPRRGHAAAYDTVNNRLIVHGGCLGFCSPIDDAAYVLLNANGLGGRPTWQKLDVTGPTPPLRNGHTVVYDSTSNRLILFGGGDCCGGRFGDTWVLTNANGLGGPLAWEPLFPSSVPPVRVGHSAVYDVPNNRMIVMGGNSPAGFLSDVWVLANANGLGGPPSWTQLNPGEPRPQPRGQQAAAFDPATNRMVVFDGSTGTEILDDVWVLANANGLGGSPSWSRMVIPGGPPPRSAAHAAFRPSTTRLVIFGGVNLTDHPTDTWVLANATTIPPQAAAPPSALTPTPLPSPPALNPGDIVVVDLRAFGGSGGLIRVDPVTGAQAPIAGGGNFVRPHGAVIAANGDIYVVDDDAFGTSGGVIRVDPRTGAQTPVSAGGRFVEPIGIALDRNDDLLVADAAAFGSGAVLRVDAATGVRTEVSWGGQFVDPTGVVVAPGGDLLVTDLNAPGEGGVFRVDPATGRQTPFTSEGLLVEPTGIVLGPRGEILVVDQRAFGGPCPIGCGGVIRLDPTTGSQTRVSSGGNLAGPRGIAVDADGLILVANTQALGNGGVIRVDPVSGAQAPLSSGGHFVSPIGIAIVPDPREPSRSPIAVPIAMSPALQLGRIDAAPGEGPTLLTWSGGSDQTVLRVARWLSNGSDLIHIEATLPAGATSFADSEAPPDEAACYGLLAAHGADSAGLDVFCVVPSGTLSTDPPSQFAIQRQTTEFVSLSWGGPPWQTQFQLSALSPAGELLRTQRLVNAERTTTDNTGGAPTCYRLDVLDGPDVLGTSDRLCVIRVLGGLDGEEPASSEPVDRLIRQVLLGR
jgi:hypothetical protein